MSVQYGLILTLDNMILNNYWRKYATYREIGWEDGTVKGFLAEKQNMTQIASFNTNTVSFSASSRINRYYDIYNRLDMLDQDVPWDGAVEALQTLSQKYKLYVFSDRSDQLREKTNEILTRLGYPLSQMTLFFKRQHDRIITYRKICLQQIIQEFPRGFAICLDPSDIQLFEEVHYTPIAITTMVDPEKFQGYIKAIYHTWPQIVTALTDSFEKK